MIKSDEKEFQNKVGTRASLLPEDELDKNTRAILEGNKDNGLGTINVKVDKEKEFPTEKPYLGTSRILTDCGKPMFDKDKDIQTTKRKLMETTYATNMQAIQDGINSKVMETGSLDDRRTFMANVASANLYGKQLATKEHPYTVPDIEVDDKTGLIKLNMQQYTPPEKTKSTVLGFNTPKNKELMDDMESKHEKDAKDSLHTLNEYADEKAVSGVQKAKGKISRENITEDAKGAVADDRKLFGVLGGAGGALAAGAAGAAVGSAVAPGVGTVVGAGVGALKGSALGHMVGKAVGHVGGTIANGIVGTVRKVPTNLGTNVVESRTATAADKAVTKAIRADVKDTVSKTKQDDRIARAEAMASNVKTSEKSSEAEFV